MNYKGVARGRIIEFSEPLPYRDGEPVNVSIAPGAEQVDSGSPGAVLRAMRQSPKLAMEDVDAMEREIERGRLPVHSENVFDANQ